MSRAQRVISSLLSVNALLLAGLLWTQIADKPILARTAVAKARYQLSQGWSAAEHLEEARNALAAGLSVNPRDPDLLALRDTVDSLAAES